MRVLISYLSYSGNTEEVAELLEENLTSNGYEVDMYDIGEGKMMPEVSEYDLLILGSFTWDYGATPDDVKDFVADVGYKPENVAVYGTGDTQFGGDDMFCVAATKLARFYNSKWDVLKIEQSPRGFQEKRVMNWVKDLVGRQVQEIA